MCIEHLKSFSSQNIGFDKIETMIRNGEVPHVKLGIDPTSPNLHLGHLVPLRAFAALLKAGCSGTLVIGDMTARIGDPTGTDAQRKILSLDEVEQNKINLLKQIKSFFSKEGLKELSPFFGHKGRWEIVFNSDITPQLEDLFSVLNTVTVNSLLGREHFAKRHREGKPIALLEMICPMLQAWDSVQIQSDLEIGGNDQLANCCQGRDLMEAFGLQPQAVLLFPLLSGTDGNKMSKSQHNHISLTDSPNDVFGKTMSIPDGLTSEWWRLLFHSNEPSSDPLTSKSALAFSITTLLHDEDAAHAASEWFDRTFRRKEIEPSEKIILESPIEILDLMMQLNWTTSKAAGRRLIDGGGVKINSTVVTDHNQIVAHNCVLQKGRRTSIEVQFD